MIVIIILAILTGIAVPSYLILRNRARVAAAQAEMRSIATALELYQADNETYPADAAWVADLEGDPLADPIVPTYMENIPDEDPWGAIAYVYAISGTGTLAGYTLTCYGADGVVGTDDIVIINGQLQE